MFKRELVVAIWRVSTVQQTIEKVAENNTGEPLAAVGIAAGITLDGRPLILVSSRSGEALPATKTKLAHRQNVSAHFRLRQ